MSNVLYVEGECNFHGAVANGAIVTDDIIIAYMGNNNIITDWHGEPIGTYTITSSWKTPRSYISSTMYQLIACVQGHFYTGRSAGVGMVFRGKKKKINVK